MALEAGSWTELLVGLGNVLAVIYFGSATRRAQREAHEYMIQRDALRERSNEEQLLIPLIQSAAEKGNAELDELLMEALTRKNIQKERLQALMNDALLSVYDGKVTAARARSADAIKRLDAKFEEAFKSFKR